jgi:hypothetical protein
VCPQEIGFSGVQLQDSLLDIAQSFRCKELEA